MHYQAVLLLYLNWSCLSSPAPFQRDTASQGGKRRIRIPPSSGGFAPEIQHVLLWILLKAEEAAGRVNIRVQSILSARCVGMQMSPVLVPSASPSFFCGKDKACHCNTAFIQVTACVCPCILPSMLKDNLALTLKFLPLQHERQTVRAVFMRSRKAPRALLQKHSCTDGSVSAVLD